MLESMVLTEKSAWIWFRKEHFPSAFVRQVRHSSLLHSQGVGTMWPKEKKTRDFDGRPYVMERALPADFAFVKGWRATGWAIWFYRKTARNFIHDGHGGQGDDCGS